MNSALEKPIVSFLSGLLQTGGLNGTDIANFAGVSKATVSRWKNNQKAPHSKTQLALSDLYYVVMRLNEHYSPDEINAWLHARHPQLEGERAIELIHDKRTEEVLDVINRLDADVYV